MPIMLDTNQTDQWIANAVKNNPCVLLASGNLRTCPVRLSFVHVFERSKPIPPNLEGSFSANLIFPPMADLTLLKTHAGNTALAKWADAGTPKGPKLKMPFKPQNEMTKYEGYGEEGVYTIAVSKKYQPSVIDIRQVPITDPARIYAGAWAIATLNPFAYDAKVNKGVSFGLQSLMIIADDKNLAGGGGGNPAEDYAGVNIDTSATGDEVFAGGDSEEEAARRALFG